MCPHVQHTLSRPQCSPPPNTHTSPGVTASAHTRHLGPCCVWFGAPSPHPTPHLTPRQPLVFVPALLYSRPIESNLLNPRTFLWNPQAWAWWWCVVSPPILGRPGGRDYLCGPCWSLHSCPDSCPALTLPCLSYTSTTK